MAEKEVKIGNKKVWEGLKIETNLKSIAWFSGILLTFLSSFYIKFRADIKNVNKETQTIFLKIDNKINTLNHNTNETTLNVIYLLQISDILKDPALSGQEKCNRIEIIKSTYNAIKNKAITDSVQPPVTAPSE